MASSFDRPLDELTKKNRGGFRNFQRRGYQKGGVNKRGGFSQRGGANQRGFYQRGGARGGFSQRGRSFRGGRSGRGSTNARGFQENGYDNDVAVNESGDAVPAVNDLRDLIIFKTKPAVTDLRSKLPPKQTEKQPVKKEPLRYIPSSNSSKKPQKLLISAGSTYSAPSSHSRSNIFSSDKSFKMSGNRLPTSSEAKKITVTVQGLNKTTSEIYRKEERLASAILRQKETRQQNYMKSREEFIASTITSALGGPAAASSHVEHAPSTSRHAAPVLPRYRSNSPNDFHYEPPQYEPRPQHLTGAAPVRPRGLTTVTTLMISNLNDTVSRNDVSELCSAIGPLENVTMIAPGVAEVTYRYKDDALEAFKKYNQRNLDGMPMVCRLQPGGGSRPRSFVGVVSGGYRTMDPYQSDPMYGGGMAGGGFY